MDRSRQAPLVLKPRGSWPQCSAMRWDQRVAMRLREAAVQCSAVQSLAQPGATRPVQLQRAYIVHHPLALSFRPSSHFHSSRPPTRQLYSPLFSRTLSYHQRLEHYHSHHAVSHRGRRRHGLPVALDLGSDHLGSSSGRPRNRRNRLYDC